MLADRFTQGLHAYDAAAAYQSTQDFNLATRRTSTHGASPGTAPISGWWMHIDDKVYTYDADGTLSVHAGLRPSGWANAERIAA